MSDFYRNQFRVDGKGAAAVAADGDGGAGAADNSGGSAAGDSKAEGGADAIDGTEPGGGAGAGSDGAGGPSEFKRPMKRPNRGSRPGGSDNIAPTPPPFYFLSTREGLIISPYTGGTTYPAVSSLEAFQQCPLEFVCNLTFMLTIIFMVPAHTLGGKGAPPGKIQRTEKQEDPEKYARKTSESAVLDAKARYLARKSARNGSRALPTMDD